MSNEKVHIEKGQVLDQLKNHYLMPGRNLYKKQKFIKLVTE